MSIKILNQSPHKNYIVIEPLDYEKEMISLSNALDERITITTKVEDDLNAQAVALDLCSKDFKFFANNFVFIQDPETEDDSLKEIPFLLYSYQQFASTEIIKAINEGYDLPIEKSRKTGLSWLLIAILVWGWNFHKWECLVGSQKFENVDKRGNIKSLLEKARFIIKRLPAWMIPNLRPFLHDKTGNLVHPLHKATIAGESNNTNFGRSDRRKVILFDEFASWELTDKAAWQSCGSTTKCRIPLSTPNTRGTNCHFYNILHNADKKKKPFLSLHWTLNPIFAQGLYFDEYEKPHSPWYDEQIARSSSKQEVAQELDINYEASMGGKVFGDFNEEKNVGSCNPEDDDYVGYNSNLPLYIGIDFGLDQTAIIWIQHDIRKDRYYVIDELTGDGTENQNDIYRYIEEINAKPYKKPLIFCDPYSGENRNMAARGSSSNATIMRKYGFVVRNVRGPVPTRINAARNILNKVKVSPNCPLTIEMFMSWQFKKDSAVPQHNEYSHLGDAFTYFAVNYRIKNIREGVRKKNFNISVSGVMG